MVAGAAPRGEYEEAAAVVHRAACYGDDPRKALQLYLEDVELVAAARANRKAWDEHVGTGVRTRPPRPPGSSLFGLRTIHVWSAAPTRSVARGQCTFGTATHVVARR